MQRSVLLFSVILFGYTMAPAAFAQRTAPAPPQNGRFGDPDVYARNFQDYLYGVIAQVHRDSLVLDKTKFGVRETIEVNRKTKFVHSGKPSSLAQLKPGDMVYVQVKKNKKTGSLTARKVVSGMGATGGV